MKRQLLKLLGLAAFAVAIVGTAMFSTGAQAAITCAQYGTNFATYPTDGANSHAYLCTNTVTGVTPTAQRANTLFAAVSSGYQSWAFPANVRSRLQTQNIKYFFFNSRGEADTYFALTAPYNSIVAPVHTFKGGNSSGTGGTRCGNTGYGWNGTTQVIAVAIYDNCSYDNFLQPPATVTNPSLERSILHETGHALDFTFGTLLDQQGFPSNRGGFDQLRIADANRLTNVWNTLTAPNKNIFVCNLFNSTYFPSNLELDLGALKKGGPNGQVCGSGNQPYAAYANVGPTQIAIDKLPYFIQNDQELWAELFVTEAFQIGSPPAFLQMTDHVLGNNIITPTRAFDCTRAVLQSYIQTLNPPAVIGGCTFTRPL